MSTYQHDLLTTRFAALAPRPLPGDWDDVLDRAGTARPRRRWLVRSSWRGGRRRRLIVALAVAGLVAVAAAAAYGTVRVLFLDKGFIGLPPVGATPSAPESGQLVIHYFGPNPPHHGKSRIWVYADGRLISLRDASFPEGANAASTGFLEQRLTPEGVDLLRSEALSTGHWGDEPPPPPPSAPACPKGVSPGTVVSPATVGCVPPTPGPSRNEPLTVPFYVNIVVPGVGRLARVDRARDLDRLVKRLVDPASWLPASAWAAREVRAYVPSRFSVCYGSWDADPPLSPSRILDLLPAAAGDVLRGRPTTKFTTVVGAPGTFRPEHDACSDVPAEDVRKLIDALDAAGIERWMPKLRLAYRFEAATSGRETVHVYLEPYLPHGEITCSACG